MAKKVKSSILTAIVFLLFLSNVFSQGVDLHTVSRSDTADFKNKADNAVLMRLTSKSLARPEEGSHDAIAWYPPIVDGAILTVLSGRKEGYLFGTSDDSVLVNSWYPPSWFSSLDSIEVFVEAPNTSGDSVCYRIKTIGIAVGEVGGTAYAQTLQDTIDLGTTNRARIKLLFSGFTGISASDEVMLELSRNNTIANNVADSVFVRSSTIYYK